MTNELAPVERVTLEQSEVVIERGLQTFVDVGNALMAIRDGRLYREQFGTFEEYCEQRWSIGASRARQLIGAAEVVNNIKSVTSGNTPDVERHVRPLTSLPPTQQPGAWQRAVETAPNGKITAAHVQSVVDEMKPSPAPVRYAPVEDDYVDDVPTMQLDEEPEEEIVWTPPKPPELPQGIKPNLQPLMTSNTYEWYTPAHIIERAREVLDVINLDPASCREANKTVQAEWFFDIEDNGLAQDWTAKSGKPSRVFMNPPYGEEIGDWVNKLANEFETGNVKEAIALLPARTDTAWMRRLSKYPRCFIWGRLKFSGSDNSATFPSIVIYLGPDAFSFGKAFEDIGDIYVLWSDA